MRLQFFGLASGTEKLDIDARIDRLRSSQTETILAVEPRVFTQEVDPEELERTDVRSAQDDACCSVVGMRSPAGSEAHVGSARPMTVECADPFSSGDDAVSAQQGGIEIVARNPVGRHATL